MSLEETGGEQTLSWLAYCWRG